MMKQAGVARRKPHQSNRLRYLATPLSYSVQSNLSAEQEQLKLAGLMLYWGEGSKRDKSTVDFANSDPKMISIFLRFLREIYQVTEDRLRVLVYCYANQSTDELIAFWSQLTTIPSSQFSRPYVRSDFRKEQIGRMPYGLVHVRYSDQRLLRQVLDDINHLTNRLMTESVLG